MWQAGAVYGYAYGWRTVPPTARIIKCQLEVVGLRCGIMKVWRADIRIGPLVCAPRLVVTEYGPHDIVRKARLVDMCTVTAARYMSLPHISLRYALAASLDAAITQWSSPLKRYLLSCFRWSVRTIFAIVWVGLASIIYTVLYNISTRYDGIISWI